jgi:hypothetical protein
VGRELVILAGWYCIEVSLHCQQICLAEQAHHLRAIPRTDDLGETVGKRF